MSVTRKTLLTWLAFLFLTHGIAYFLSPEHVHDPSSPYKYVKYLIVLVYILFTIRDNFSSKAIFFASLIPLAVYYNLINADPDMINFVGYVLPAYFLFDIKNLRQINWRAIVVWTILITSMLGYYEVIFLDNHFYMYNRSFKDYRMVSIFLNPNNLGVVITLFTFAYLEFFSTRKILSWLCFFNGLLIVVLSGSKTGIGVFMFFSLYILYLAITNRHSENALIKRADLKYLVFAIPVVLVVALRLISMIDLSEMRDFNWGSLLVRLRDYNVFFSLVRENYLFPWISTTKNIDNMYLHIWGSFGFPALALFIAFNLFLFFKITSRKMMAILLGFLLIGFTTNYMYLWPLGYIYWAFLSICFTPQHSLRLERLSLNKYSLQNESIDGDS
jgi:hypothetical protein